MKNQAKAAEVTPELMRQVEAVLADAANHKYSVSKVYAAYNTVFEKNDTPESCASCLKKRVDELRPWYTNQLLEQTDANVNPNKGNADGLRISVEEVYTHYGVRPTEESEESDISTLLRSVTNENDRALLLARLHVIRANQGITTTAPETFSVNDKDGNALDVLFTSQDGVNGTLTYTNEAGETKNVKAGTYTTENGDSYAVQPGGKATYKSDVL